jgi:hypothetical protein
MSTPEWLLTLKKGVTYEMPETDGNNGGFEQERPETPSALKQQSNGEESVPKPTVCHAYLQSFDQKGGENANKVDGTLVYAIIGCGYSATVNRATLSKAQIDGLPIVHIGYPDPWTGYVSHNMNQAVELNTVPGFKHQPPDVDSEKNTSPQARWLTSTAFAKATEEERKRFLDDGQDKLIQAGVTNIAWIEDAGGCFKIELDNNCGPVFAKKVDVCTGPGQQSVLDGPKSGDNARYGIKMPEALWLEYLNPPMMKTGVTTKNRVFSAEMYVRGTVKPKPGGFVCVTGASPAGIQALEHALCEDIYPDTDEGYQEKRKNEAAAEAVLVASRKVNDGFLAIGRLDYHAKDSLNINEGELPTRQGLARGKLYPTNEKICFAEDCRIDSIEPLAEKHRELFEEFDYSVPNKHPFDAGNNRYAVLYPTLNDDIEKGRLLVCFRTTAKDGNLVDNQGNTYFLQYGKFDQVALGSLRSRGGVKDDDQQVGSALNLVWDAFKEDLKPLQKVQKFPLGLECDKGDSKLLRILGPAGINNPLFLGKMKKSALGLTPLGFYERSLPAHARVNGEGVTLAAHTIAWANEFYTQDKAKLNTNVNTATQDELTEFLGVEHIAKDGKLADHVYKMRSRRVGPYIHNTQFIHSIDLFMNYKDVKEKQEQEVLKIKEALYDKSQELGGQERLLRAKKTELKSYADNAEMDNEKQLLQEEIDGLNLSIPILKQEEQTLWEKQIGFVRYFNDDNFLFSGENEYQQTVAEIFGQSVGGQVVQGEAYEGYKKRYLKELNVVATSFESVHKVMFKPHYFVDYAAELEAGDFKRARVPDA